VRRPTRSEAIGAELELGRRAIRAVTIRMHRCGSGEEAAQRNEQHDDV
jgi:hypothetical protein